MTHMGAEFHRVVMAALAAGLLVIPGCSAGDGSPSSHVQDPPAVAAAGAPTIVSAQLEGASSLRLTFSEAMKPAIGVDPAKFRLTVAYFTRPASASSKYNYQYYAGGYHGAQPGTGTYAGKTYGGTYYGSPDHTIYSEAAPIDALVSDPAVSDQTVLQLGSTFSAASACKEIAAFNAANPNAQAGLYLHYSEAGTPTVEDVQGNKLASLAAYWSADPTIEQVKGDFAGKPIPVALTCP
jgi:hypothetical protein